MVSDLARVSVTLLVVSGLAFGGALALSDVNGPYERDEPVPPPERLATLVDYPLQTFEIATEPQQIPGSGVLDFPPIAVALRNVTSLSVTFRIQVEGPTVLDRYEVYVTSPDQVQMSGSYQAPSSPNPAGYDQTVLLINQWARAQQPGKQAYDTGDPDEALRQSAAEHTDNRSTGDWLVHVEMTPPAAPLRTATASVLFRFSYYEGVAYPTLDPSTTPHQSPEPLWGGSSQETLPASRPYPIRS